MRWAGGRVWSEGTASLRTAPCVAHPCLRPRSHSRCPQTEATPLHYSAQNGHTSAIVGLIKAKADVDARDKVRQGRATLC